MVSKVLYSKLFPKKRKSSELSPPEKPDDSSASDDRADDNAKSAGNKTNNSKDNCFTGGAEDETATAHKKSLTGHHKEQKKEKNTSTFQQEVNPNSNDSGTENILKMDVDMDNAANSLLMLSSKTEASDDNPNKKMNNGLKKYDSSGGSLSNKEPYVAIGAATSTAFNGLGPISSASSRGAEHHHKIASASIGFHAHSHIFNSLSSYSDASHSFQHNRYLRHPYQPSPQHQQIHINPYTNLSSSPPKANFFINCKHCSKCKQFVANNSQMLHEAIDCIFQRKFERTKRREEDMKLAERRTSAQGYKEITPKQIESIVTHGAAYGIEIPIPTRLSCPVDMLRKMVYKSASNKWAKVESRRKQQISANGQTCLDEINFGTSSNTSGADGTSHPPNKRRRKILTVNEKIIAMTMGSHYIQNDFSVRDSSCFCNNCRTLTGDVHFLDILKNIFITSYRFDPPTRYPENGYLPLEKEHREAIIATGASYGVDFPITTKLKHTEDFLRNAATNSNRNKSKRRVHKFKSKQDVKFNDAEKFLDSATFQTFKAKRLTEEKGVSDQNHNVIEHSATEDDPETIAPMTEISSNLQTSDEITHAVRSSQNSRLTGTSSAFHSKKISQRSFGNQATESISRANNHGDHASDCDEFDISVRSSDAESDHEELEDGEVFSAQEKHILDKLMRCKE